MALSFPARRRERAGLFAFVTPVGGCLDFYHKPVKTGPPQAHEQFAQANNLASEQERAQKELQCFLTVFQNDPDRLKAFWERHHNPNFDLPAWEAFTDAAGDLPTLDQDIIAEFIELVETPRPVMFFARMKAMVTLGKIGPPAGLRAVEVIEKSIYDSSGDVTAIRNTNELDVAGFREAVPYDRVL